MTSAMVVAVALGGLVSFLDLGWQSVTVLVIGLFSLFVWTLYRSQADLLYQRKIYPQFLRPEQNPPGYRSPAEHGIPFDNLYLRSSDGERLHAWFLRQPEPRSAPTLLFLHANAGNMGFRLPNLANMHRLLRVNIFVLSYRGYGESSGLPSEPGLIADAEAAFEWLRASPHVDMARVLVFGRSMGGAVAIALAERHADEIAALVLENTFTSISEMVDKIFPYLSPIKGFILRLKWESHRRVGAITCPTLFLSGQKDEVVPVPHMSSLYALATSSRRRSLVRFPGGMHNDTWTKLGYMKAWHEFLRPLWGDYVDSLPPPPETLAMLPAEEVIAKARAREAEAAGGATEE